MGLIAKQSIKGSIYTYSGAVLGFVSTGLLMPKFFELEEVGLINLLVALSLIFTQFSNLGFNYILSRIFPYFRNNKNKHNGILTLGIYVSLIGFAISLVIFLLLKPYLVESNIEKSALFAENIYYIPPLIFFTVFFFLLDNYNKALYNAVLGTFIREFVVRFLNLFIIIFYIFEIIDFQNFILWYAIIYSSPAIIISVILIKNKRFHIRKLNMELIREHKSEMIKIAGFGLISGFSGMAVLNIDRYMINHYLGLEATGVYSISFYFGALIMIPAKAVRKISSIVIAESWKKNDLSTINKIYSKSTVNQLIIALLLYIGIWVNIDNIFKILPDYSEGRYVILFIGFAFVFEMFSGVSSTIISNSKYYKFGSYVMLIKIILIIILNMFFIPVWKLSGGAFASLLTVLITIFLYFIFLFKKYKFQPYSYKHLIIIAIGGFAIAVNYFIPEFYNFYIDIIIRSGIISIIFVLLIYISKVSDEVTNIAEMIKQYIKKHFFQKRY